MHMADALLSPAVGTTMYIVSTAAIARSTSKIKLDVIERKIPLMAVTGSFIFAAQMINFTIPGTGSSGHIGGGMMLAAMLGGYPAMLTLSAVLLIQALFFADGGLFALGANLFNIAVIPCLIVYPLIYKPILKKGIDAKRLTIASILSAVVALQLGAFGVVIQTLFSGVTALPFAAFSLMMQPIHLAIGIVEGVVTALVLNFVYKTRPEILDDAIETKGTKPKFHLRKLLIGFGIASLLIAGGLSYFASVNPDGLEWSIQNVAGVSELFSNESIHAISAKIQELTSFLPGYAPSNDPNGTGLAGIIGSLITFALAGGVGVLIYVVKKKKIKSTSA